MHKAVIIALSALAGTAFAIPSALAQSQGAAAVAQAQAPPTRLQTPAEALAQDAAEYATQTGVAFNEAVRRLAAQEGSVAATDRLRSEFADRLAGIAIEHLPSYRISVLLAGEAPVRDRFIAASGTTIPVVFRTGARATHDQLVEALRLHQPAIKAALAGAQGMGVDPRTGELVVLVKEVDLDVGLVDARQAELAALAGVPVRIRLLDREGGDFAVEGGSRVVGVDPGTGRRAACTTGFVVTDNARTGIVTAAHCPDSLSYYGPDGSEIPLGFVGEWGALFQDVQVHVTAAEQRPEFYVDRERKIARPLTGRRARVSTRAGDVVCHRGESSGYSCSQVELIDFAPPGSLCGGPCDPVWITVAGPGCRGGDSGGPIFTGTTAFGIVKGGSYRRSGECNFYYYMSTDYLPHGWSLLLSDARHAPTRGAARNAAGSASLR